MEPYSLRLRHPDWNRPDDPEFNDHYTSIIDFQYSLRDSPLGKQCIGTQGKCALCNKSSPDVSFSHEAHLLPAAIGNRQYFSNEECNPCNKEFGEATENSLAKMLAIEQALYRVPIRKGTAKLKPRPHLDKEASFLGAETPNGVLRVNTFPHDDSVQVSFEPSNTFALTASAPLYKPTIALKSILKSFWLGCQQDALREKFDFIRQYIRNEIQIPDSYMLTFFVPRDLDNVTFQAWLRRPECNLTTAPLVIRLLFGNTCIIWCSPEPDLFCLEGTVLTHGPSLLPCVDVLEPRAHLTGYKILCNSSEDTIQRHTRSYNIQYATRLSDKDSEDQTSSKLHLHMPKMLAVAEVIKDGNLISSVTTVLTVERYDADGLRFHIEGMNLAASLLFDYEVASKRVTFEEKRMFHNYSSRIVLGTLAFLQFAYVVGTSLRIKVSLAGSPNISFIDEFPFYRNVELPEYFEPIRRFSDLLLEINTTLNIDLRLPMPGAMLPFRMAEFLVQIFRTGEAVEAGEIQFQIPSSTIEDFYAAAKSNLGEASFIEPSQCVDFLGQTIDLGKCQFSMTNIVPITTYDEAQELARQAEYVNLRCSSDRVIKRYDNWLKKRADAADG